MFWTDRVKGDFQTYHGSIINRIAAGAKHDFWLWNKNFGRLLHNEALFILLRSRSRDYSLLFKDTQPWSLSVPIISAAQVWSFCSKTWYIWSVRPAHRTPGIFKVCIQRPTLVRVVFLYLSDYSLCSTWKSPDIWIHVSDLSFSLMMTSTRFASSVEK